MGDLKKHKEAKHEGIRYPCDQCEYSASQKGQLKSHKEAKHLGIRYPCDQCEYTTAYAVELRKHKEVKHEGIRYPCDQCAYIATRMDRLNKHKKTKHENCEFSSAVENPSPSKYQDFLEQDPDFIEVSEMYNGDKEIKTEMDIDPLSIIDYDDGVNNTTMVEMKEQNCLKNNIEPKIEIDLVMKTETPDISESDQ